MADWSWITDRIAVGSEPQPSDVRAMREQGITDVLDVRGEPTANGAPERPMPERYRGTGIDYHYVPMRDNGSPQPASVYQRGVSVIQYAMSDPRRKILVHCAAGANRSPSMVYAYLRKAGLSAGDARDAVMSHRTQTTGQYFDSADRAVPVLPYPPPPVLVRRITAGVLLAAGAAAVYYAMGE